MEQKIQEEYEEGFIKTFMVAKQVGVNVESNCASYSFGFSHGLFFAGFMSKKECEELCHKWSKIIINKINEND